MLKGRGVIIRRAMTTDDKLLLLESYMYIVLKLKPTSAFKDNIVSFSLDSSLDNSES